MTWYKIIYIIIIFLIFLSRLPASPTEIHRPAEIPGPLSKNVVGILYLDLKTGAGCTWQGRLALSTRSVDPARDLHKACCARVGKEDEDEALRRDRESRRTAHAEGQGNGARQWAIELRDRLLHGCFFRCSFCRRLCIPGMWKNGVPSSFELVQSPRSRRLVEGNIIPATRSCCRVCCCAWTENGWPDLCQATRIALFVSCKAFGCSRAAAFCPVGDELEERIKPQERWLCIPGLHGRCLRRRGSVSSWVSKCWRNAFYSSVTL